MSANATHREGRAQQATKSSSRRSMSTAVTGSHHDGGRSRGHDAGTAATVWSTDASRHGWSRSRSADARSARSRCRGCAGDIGESMETLEVRLLSPDSGAIVFSPENDLTTTTTTLRTTPDWPNEVRSFCRTTSETVRVLTL